MRFIFNELEGEKPITEWLARKIKKYISEKRGLDVLISIHLPSENTQDAAEVGLCDEC